MKLKVDNQTKYYSLIESAIYSFLIKGLIDRPIIIKSWTNEITIYKR